MAWQTAKIDRGCVKTADKKAGLRKIDASERATLNDRRFGNSKRNPENIPTLRFYTAWTQTGRLAQRLTKRREGISFLGAHQRPALIPRGTPETNAAGNPSLSILLMLPAGW